VFTEQGQEKIGDVTQFLYRQAEIVTSFQRQPFEMSATLEHAIVLLSQRAHGKIDRRCGEPA
jgi:hypothetical protein